MKIADEEPEVIVLPGRSVLDEKYVLSASRARDPQFFTSSSSLRQQSESSSRIGALRSRNEISSRDLRPASNL